MSTFPILKDEEILMCLAEMGIEIGKNDLHTPNSDVVRGVYERIIDGLMGVTREEMQAVPHDVVEDLAFPELHDESAAAMSFFKHLRKLFSASGVKDFSLKDVFQPEAKRLKRHLSGVINFIKYREEKVIVYVECHEQLEQTQAQREQLMDENSRLSAELQMLIAEEAREKPEVEGIQKEVEQLRGREVLLEQQYESLTVKGNKLKASYQAGRDQLKQLKLEQAAAVQKRNRLADRIVERPDKLLAELKELESRTNAERQAVKESQQLAHSTKDRIDVVERVRKEVAKLKEGMEDVQLAVEAKKEASRSVKQLSRAIADVERQLSEAQQVQLALRTRRTCNLEKISRIEAQKSSKSDAVRSKVEEQKRSKVAVEAQNAATAARMAENKAQMKQLKEQMEALEEGHTQLQQSTMQLYNRLRTTVTQFHASLFGALGEDPALPEVPVATMPARDALIQPAVVH